MEAPIRRWAEFRSALVIALGTCVALALIDVLGGLLRAPHTLSPLSAALTAGSLSLLAFCLLYVGTAIVLGPYLTFVFRLHPVRCAISFSTFWTVVLIASAVTLGAHMPRDSAQRRTLLLCVGVALIAAVVAYPIAARLGRSAGAAASWARKAVLAPFVLATVVGALWLRHHGAGGGGAVVALAALSLACLVGITASTGDEPARRWRRAALLTAWGIAIAACVGVGAAATDRPAGQTATIGADVRVPHVILIVVDTLRADALSCYGQTAIGTPHIDRFAQQAVRFDAAVSAAPWTIPGVASLMTGLSPLAHGVRSGGVRIPENAMTLAEYLKESGYRTATIGHNPHLSPLHTNLNQGFDEYNMFPRMATDTIGDKLFFVGLRRFRGRPPEVSTTQLTDMAIDWVTAHAEEPFFLWLHYFDPHLPYAPPAEYLAETQPSPAVGRSFVDVRSIREGHFVPSAADRARLRELYLAEVRYVDDEVNRFLRTLADLDIFDDALIILTSDHGEEFWEHDGYEHGHTVYREVLDVPLIVKAPANAATGVVAQPVSTECIPPTVLELCGIEFQANTMTGQSLVPLLAQPSVDRPTPPILSTGLIYYEDRIGLMFEGHKYIRRLVSGREELYDLRTDPGEQHNLLPTDDEAQLMQARTLVAEREQDAARLKEYWNLGEPAAVEMDDATLEHLRSLGYLGD